MRRGRWTRYGRIGSGSACLCEIEREKVGRREDFRSCQLTFNFTNCGRTQYIGSFWTGSSSDLQLDKGKAGAYIYQLSW